MPELTAAFRRVPKWAWYTSAGVGIGAMALYVVRNRAGTEDPGDTTDTSLGDGTQPTGYPDTFSPSPVPGIVVPDINIPGDTTGESGYLDLHNLYMEGLRDVLDAFGAVQTPAAPAPVISPMPTIITGGGVSCTPRNGTHTVQCSPATKKDPCTGKYPQLDKSGRHKGQCFYATLERRSVKQSGRWFCLRQYKRHYRNGTTEWGGVKSKTKGKC